MTGVIKSLRGALMVLLCLGLLSDAACTRQAPNTMFPSTGVEGWARVGEIRTFEAADLWKYIDGEAERYLKAGVQRVSTADYKFQNKIDVVIDIYTMGNEEGAAKILESEPTGDAKQIQLGDGARLYSQSLIFRKGPYLARIVAYQESAEIPQAIEELGRSIEARLTK